METRRNKIAEDERCDFATLNFILYEKSIKPFDSFAHTFLTFLPVKFNDSFAQNEHRSHLNNVLNIENAIFFFSDYQTRLCPRDRDCRKPIVIATQPLTILLSMH